MKRLPLCLVVIAIELVVGPKPILESRAETLLIGDNLTPTTYTLHQNQWTAGTYAIGYGVTDNLMVATSPWFFAGYGMAVAEIRYRFFKEGPIESTIEPLYFKTLGFSRYIQESAFIRWTTSYRFSEEDTLHFSFGNQYFWNDSVPYSLDPYPGLQKYLPSVSVLNEVHVSEMFGGLVELGLIGLNYPIWFGHAGLSAFYQNSWLMVQMGISITSLFPNSVGLIYWFTHPETQIQTSFYF